MNPMLLVALGLFAGLGLGVFLLGAAMLSRGSGTNSRRLRAFLGGEQEPPPRPNLARRLEGMVQPVARILPVSGGEASRTRAWLLRAGYREARHAHFYFGVRALSVLVLLAAVLATGLAARAPLALIAAPALGLMLPRFILKRRIAARAKRIRLSLPDALDLMVICVEAGLGLDQAIQKVAGELKTVHADLCGELELLVLEMRAGIPRAEALRHLSDRCQVDDIRALAAVLIQTDRFGTSVAQALRVHSDSLRTERRQRAEEAAAKLSIKMLPVLAMFVFPAVMIVVMGPALISLIRHLGPVLAQ